MFPPFNYMPLNDTQPFTFRDSFTFLERLRLLYKLITEMGDKFDAHVAYVAKLIETVNNRVGSPEVIHIDLSNGNKIVNVPDEFPTNHDFYVIVKQGAAGGNTIELPSSISGVPYIDARPKAESIVHFMPNGDGTFFVDNSMQRIVDLVNAVDVKIDTSVDNINNRITLVQNDLVEQIAAGGRVSKQYTDQLRSDVTVIVDTINNRITANKAEAKTDIDTVRAEMGQMNTTLTGEIFKKVDKSLIINVKDFGAKGDGATDDTAAINAAMVAAGPAQQVYFPPGKFLISAPIKTLISQTIVGASSNGEGGNNTEIKSTHAGNAIELANGVTLTRMKFYGPGFGTAGSVAIYSADVQVGIREVSIWDYDTGISLKEVWLGLIDRAQIKLCKRAMLVDYCYNLNIFSCMIYCKTTATSRGEGIICTNQSMINVFGGSIENYTTAITVAGNGSVACFGVYFETANNDNNPNKARGIYATNVGASTVVTAVGCQVYLNDMQSFIEYDTLDNGELIMAMGNKFKSSEPGSCIAYNLRAAAAVSIPNIRVVLLGDSWANASGDGHKFMRSDTMTPIGSIVNPPLRDYGSDSSATAAKIRIGGALEMNSYRTDEPGPQMMLGYVKPGAAPRAYSNAELPGDWTVKAGAIMWNDAKKKLMVWNGTTWTDAIGGVL